MSQRTAEQQKAYYYAHRDRILSLQKAKLDASPELRKKRNEYHQKWCQANREKIRCARAEYRMRRKAAGRKQPYIHTPEKADKCRRYYQANKEQVKSRVAAHRLANIEKVRAYDRQRSASAEKRAACKLWCEQHPEQVKATKRRYQEINGEELRAKSRAGYQKNKQSYLARAKVFAAMHPDRRAEYAKRYYSKNPERYRAYAHARRAKQRGLKAGDRKEYAAWIKAMRSARDAECFWCGRVVPRHEREIDHIVPIALDGPDVVENLCCSCRRCNRRKGKRSPEKFRQIMAGLAIV
jgi:5-methylcytosine-specific restriction endonuclease McrA